MNNMDISSNIICTREDLDMDTKGKSQERNWIFSNSSAEQRHKDQLF